MTIPDHVLLTLRLLANSLDEVRSRAAFLELQNSNFAAVIPPECYVVWVVEDGKPRILASVKSRQEMQFVVDSHEDEGQVAVQQWNPEAKEWQMMELNQ